MTHIKSKLDLANWLSSALSLVAILLWPCFVHASCCCSEHVRLLERLISTGELAVVARSAESACTDDSRILEADFACSKCCTAAANAAQVDKPASASDCIHERMPCSAMAWCHCLIESPAASLAPRVEINYEAEPSVPVTITLRISGLHKSQALTSVHDTTNPRIQLTSNERCARCCCWLN